MVGTPLENPKKSKTSQYIDRMEEVLPCLDLFD